MLKKLAPLLIFVISIPSAYLLYLLFSSTFGFDKHTALATTICTDIGGESLCSLGYLILFYWVSVLLLSFSLLVVTFAISKTLLNSKLPLLIFIVSLVFTTPGVADVLSRLYSYHQVVSECDKYTFPESLKISEHKKDELIYRLKFINSKSTVGQTAIKATCIVEAEFSGEIVSESRVVSSTNYQINFKSRGPESRITDIYQQIYNNYYYVKLNNWIFTYPLTEKADRTGDFKIVEEPMGAITDDNGNSWAKINVKVDESSIPYLLNSGLVEMKMIEKVDNRIILNGYSNFYQQSINYEFIKSGGTYIFNPR